MPAGLQMARGDVVFNFVAQAATATSAPFAAPSEIGPLLVTAHLSAVTGTTPTLDITVEQSANGTSGWAAITGAALTQVTAAGNRVGFANPTLPYVRLVATIGGTTPAFTGTVAVFVFTD